MEFPAIMAPAVTLPDPRGLISLKILIALITLLLLALAVGPRVKGRLPFSRRFLLVGGEFILAGWALGEHGLGLLDRATLAAVEPLLLLGLGWIGLLVGLQFELRLLRRVPRTFYSVAILQGLFVFLTLLAVLYPLLARLLDPGAPAWAAAFFLAGAGADSSQHILALASRERRHHPHAPLHLLQFCAEIDNLIPFIGLAVLAGLLQEHAALGSLGPAWLSLAIWIGLGTLLGVALGLLLALLIRGVRKSSHHILLIIGFLALSGGLGHALGFPPLYLNMIAGIVTVNLAGHHTDTWRLAAASERPFYFIFLLLVGASWQLGSLWSLALAPLFFLLRILGKMGGLWLAGRIAFRKPLLGPRVGLSLCGQSGVSVALVASFILFESGGVGDGVHSVILIGFLLSALIGPGLTIHSLERKVQS